MVEDINKNENTGSGETASENNGSKQPELNVNMSALHAENVIGIKLNNSLEANSSAQPRTQVTMVTEKAKNVTGVKIGNINNVNIGFTEFQIEQKISLVEYTMEGKDIIQSNSLAEKVDLLSKELQKKKIVVVNCLDKPIQHTVVKNISKHKKFSSTELHQVEASEGKRYSRDTFKKLIEASRKTKSTKCPLLVINESSEYGNSLPFLDFLFEHTSEVRIQMERNDLYIIYLVSSPDANKRIYEYQFDAHFYYERVEYVTYLLEEHFKNDTARVREASGVIEKKRACGYLPGSDREWDFYKQLKNLIHLGKLEEILEEKNEETLLAAKDDLGLKLGQLMLIPLNKCVLTVVINIPRISIRDLFQLVKILLLSDQKPITKPPIIQENKSLNEEEKSSEKNDPAPSDLEIWTSNADEVLEQCFLGPDHSSDSDLVTFYNINAQDYFTEKIKNQVIYVHRMMSIFVKQGTFFDEVFSERIMDASLPAIISFLKKCTTQERISLLCDWFGHNNSCTQRNDSQNTCCSHFSRIIISLIEDKELKNSVDLFFARITEQDTNSDKLLLLICEVGLEASYPVFQILLNFMDRQPEENRGKVESCVYLLAHSRLPDCYSVYSEISTRLPQRGNMPSDKKPSELFALLFIETWFVLPKNITPNDWGKWPSAYSLFKVLFHEKRNSIKARLELIIQWMIRPELTIVSSDESVALLTKAFSQELSEILIDNDLSDVIYKTEEIGDFISFLDREFQISKNKPSAKQLFILITQVFYLTEFAERIIYWYLILVGERSQHATVAASETCDILFQVILENIDRKRLTVLYWHWERMINGYQRDNRVPIRCIQEMKQRFIACERKLKI